MDYIIEHCFDNPYFINKLEVNTEEKLDRLRRERSKSRLTFQLSNGGKGEVFILSAEGTKKQNAGDSVMGFGAPNVILDEAALITDKIESKIFRMLGDSMDNFYLKIGNPFHKNHFYKSYLDPRYHKINIDYKVGIKEGRLTEEFLDEARSKPNFSVLYENQFPDDEELDAQGYTSLLTETEFRTAQGTVYTTFGIPTLGVDVARGGGCLNVFVVRWGNFAKVVAKLKDVDLMTVCGKTIQLAKKYNIHPYNVFIDDCGVGGGVTDRLHEQAFYSHAVVGSEKPLDSLFLNKRAENHWLGREWLLKGGKLDELNDWSDMQSIKYRTNSSGKIQIISKIDLVKEGYPSPDTSDAFFLTFASPPYADTKEETIFNSPQKCHNFNRFDVI